jgi:hypothetical protein
MKKINSYKFIRNSKQLQTVLISLGGRLINSKLVIKKTLKKIKKDTHLLSRDGYGV